MIRPLMQGLVIFWIFLNEEIRSWMKGKCFTSLSCAPVKGHPNIDYFISDYLHIAVYGTDNYKICPFFVLFSYLSFNSSVEPLY